MTPQTQEMQLPTATTNTAIAETYLEAVRTKDPSKALFAPEVTLQFPLTPRASPVSTSSFTPCRR